MLGLVAFGQVARYFRKSDKVLVLVPEGGDHHVSPELRTVFSNAPALILDAALAASDREQLSRVPDQAILVSVELLKIASDDLFRRVALQTASALVPREHRALG